jgi:hypothetical protein
MASELRMQHTARGLPGPTEHCCIEWRVEDGVYKGQPCCLLLGHPAAALYTVYVLGRDGLLRTTDDHGGYCVCCRQLHWRDCMQSAKPFTELTWWWLW